MDVSSRDSALLLDRLLHDPGFRARFNADPEAAAREAGFEHLAEEVRADPGRAFETLEIRESRSSLAGAMMAAAVEGLALLEVPDDVQAHAPTTDRPDPAGAAQTATGTDDAPVDEDEEPDDEEPDEEEDEDEADDDDFDADDGDSSGAESDRPAQRDPPAPVEPGHDLKPDPEQYGMAGGGGARSPIDTAVLDDQNITLDANGRQDFAKGRMDPRVGTLLLRLAERHEITISSTTSDHPQGTAGGSTSNHWYGRAFDIATVDGEIVRPDSAASRALADELATVDPSFRPDEIGTPWAIGSPGYFTDGSHQDHIHIAFDQAIEPRWRPPGENEAMVMPAITPDEVRAGRNANAAP